MEFECFGGMQELAKHLAVKYRTCNSKGSLQIPIEIWIFHFEIEFQFIAAEFHLRIESCSTFISQTYPHHWNLNTTENCP